MVLHILREGASILHHDLHQQGETQVLVIIINHMVGEEGLEIDKEHLEIDNGHLGIGREDQEIDKGHLEIGKIDSEIEVDHISNGVTHHDVVTIHQEVVGGVRTHKGLQETIMVLEEEMIVEDQQHQNKTTAGGVAVPAMKAETVLYIPIIRVKNVEPVG